MTVPRPQLGDTTWLFTQTASEPGQRIHFDRSKTHYSLFLLKRLRQNTQAEQQRSGIQIGTKQSAPQIGRGNVITRTKKCDGFLTRNTESNLKQNPQAGQVCHFTCTRCTLISWSLRNEQGVFNVSLLSLSTLAAPSVDRYSGLLLYQSNVKRFHKTGEASQSRIEAAQVLVIL